MAKHKHKDIDSMNIPPGELGRLEEGLPRGSDANFSIGNELMEMRRRERKALGLKN